MIIKGHQRKSNSKKDWSVLIVIALLAIILLANRFITKEKPNTTNTKGIAFCSAEEVQGDVFVNEDNQFLNAKTQSNEKAKNGEYCSVLDTELKGITFQLKNPTVGQTYKASVWRRAQDVNNSFLAVRSNSGDFFFETNIALRYDTDFWGHLELTFTIPEGNETNDFEVYVYKNEGSPIAFFDDFKIELYNIPQPFTNSSFIPDSLIVQIDSKGLDKLNRVKDRAQKTGIYVKEETDIVEARVLHEGRFKDAKMRFKGDWLDHLSWKGESYRVEMNKQESWNGLQTFSVQRPGTRYFLNEWVYHQFLRHEDVLTSRYDFIYFKINENPAKIYALEEHFNKNLVEHQLRREGPIIKMDESRVWEGVKRGLDEGRDLASGAVENKNEALWSAEISPFKASRTAKDSVLFSQFVQGQNLVYQFKNNLKPANEIFDIERMAKFTAITEICKAHHALTWHNQRFYYNPVSNLLEPIGFDGFASEDPAAVEPLKRFSDDAYLIKTEWLEPMFLLFKDTEFIKAYVKAIIEYSDQEYINVLMSEMEQSIADRETFLKQSEPNYSHNRNLIKDRAKMLRKEIWPFENSLQVYSDGFLNDSIKLKLINHHSYPLEITIPENPPRTLIVFPQRNNEVPKYLDIKASKQVKSLEFALPGNNKKKETRISPFPTPVNTSARQQLNEENRLSKYITDEDEFYVFNALNIVIDEPVIVPNDKGLKVSAGSVIQFKDQGFLLSESPVQFLGTEDQPILVESLDGENGSITVLQAKEVSTIQHTTFKNQNTLNYQGWNLTGAVTFYESEVHIDHVKFISNQCEDGLNIIKSNFIVANSHFENIKSDAFDADYCVGKLSNSTFKNTGNDAIDFSTSQIEVTDCSMEQIGDKAISAGEQATISAKNIQINGANFAVASKDKSILTLENIDMRDCETGFAAYQKKPEFGSATIICSKFEANNVNKLFMIEEGSAFIKN